MTLVLPIILGIAVLVALAVAIDRGVKAYQNHKNPPLDLSYKRYMRERLEWQDRGRLYGGMIGEFPDKDLWEGQQLNVYRAKYGKWPKEMNK